MPLNVAVIGAGTVGGGVIRTLLENGDVLRAKGGQVVVTALCPGYTDTKMLDNPEQGPKLEVPKGSVLAADFVAAEGIEGCLAGEAMVIPGLANRIGMPLVQCLPKIWVTRLVGTFYRRAQS